MFIVIILFLFVIIIVRIINFRVLLRIDFNLLNSNISNPNDFNNRCEIGKFKSIRLNTFYYIGLNNGKFVIILFLFTILINKRVTIILL